MKKHTREKLIASHSEPLSSDELIEFEAALAADEETHTEIEEEEKAFITKEMSLGFQELNSFLPRFEKMDLDTDCFLKVQKMVECSVAFWIQTVS
ncbi:hypothetical protein QE152_g75 [Popillia japonica]|uniref:Uncharacterized protein n=1 Tax=Popillia japonica TaxID=7064 RepID=A0AAW1NKC5_POPJA